jgi:hypothetical protein
VFVTSWQIIRNIAGLVRNRDQPSKELERVTMLKFANYLVAARARTEGIYREVPASL